MYKYKFIVIPLIGVILSQIIKFIIESLKNKKICLDRLFNGSGGMPSTHSTLVSSLTTLILLEYKLDSVYFAIALIFSLVIIYDSMGVRYQSGEQAKILNDIIKEINFTKKMTILKEKIGHKPIEVLCGILLGVSVSLILYR